MRAGGLPVFQPAIPALDFQRTTTSHSAAAAALLPKLLRSPLIKRSFVAATDSASGVEESAAAASVLLGYASGVRSAVLKVEGQWYRLKGCGNHEAGFITKDDRKPILDKNGCIVGSGKVQTISFRHIRGCCFPHTAVRELAISERLNSALRAVDAGVACACDLRFHVLMLYIGSRSQHASCYDGVLRRCGAASRPYISHSVHRGANSGRQAPENTRAGWVGLPAAPPHQHRKV